MRKIQTTNQNQPLIHKALSLSAPCSFTRCCLRVAYTLQF